MNIQCTYCGAFTSGSFCGECGKPILKSNTSTIRVGTAPDNDVVISDPSISSYHLEIITEPNADVVTVKDLGSTNGTWIHGQRISEMKQPGQMTNISVHDSIILGTKPISINDLIGPKRNSSQSQHGSPEQFSNSRSPTKISKHLLIGREQPADFIIQNPMVSSSHLEVRLNKGQLQIIDLGSTNGTFINGQRTQGWSSLTSYDKLLLGSYRIPPYQIQDWIFSLQSNAPTQNRSVEIPFNGEITIGRNPRCDVVMDSLQVSWEHAKIISQGGAWTIVDLGSSNGTIVNGQRTKKSPITKSDKIYLGPIQLNLSLGKIDHKPQVKGEVRLDAINLVRRLPHPVNKTILDDVSVSIYPGELVALMGPSGAGKTTLLEILTAQKRPTSGWVLFNDDPLHERPHLLSQIGYVPQEDIMHRDLTVFQVLYYAAKIRLPSEISEAQITQHVEQLIERMGLAHIRDSIIGGEKERGISGGQRKRVNIAIELITEPPLLFLDEPTSGLDATSTLEVLEVLRNLADNGKTIIMTIHQPRIEVFQGVDQLLLLTKGGKLAYFGPTSEATAYFSKRSTLQIAANANPADYVIDVLDPRERSKAREPDDWKADYQRSNTYQQYVQNRLNQKNNIPNAESISKPLPPQDGIYQLKNLLHRYWTRKKRDKASLRIQLLQPFIIGSLLALLFSGNNSKLPTDSKQLREWHCLTNPDGDKEGDEEGTWFAEPDENEEGNSNKKDKNKPVEKYCKIHKAKGVPPPVKDFLEKQNNENKASVWDPDEDTHPAAKTGIFPTLFLLAASAFWLGCSNVARELVAERPIYLRERRSGLRIPSYLSSVFILQLLLATVQVIIMGMLVWAFVPLGGSTMLISWGVLFITAAAGISVGLLISSWAKTEVTAISIIPIVLLPQLMLAGYLKIWSHLGGVGQALGSFLPLRWSFNSLVEIEYSDWIESDKLTRAESKMTFTVNDVFGFPSMDVSQGGLVLLILTSAALAGTFVFLKRTGQ